MDANAEIEMTAPSEIPVDASESTFEIPDFWVRLPADAPEKSRELCELVMAACRKYFQEAWEENLGEAFMLALKLVKWHDKTKTKCSLESIICSYIKRGAWKGDRDYRRQIYVAKALKEGRKLRSQVVLTQVQPDADAESGSDYWKRLTGNEPDPSDQAEFQQLSQKLNAAVATLSAEDRDILESLTINDEASYRVERRLGLSPQKMKRKHQAILEKLEWLMSCK